MMIFFRFAISLSDVTYFTLCCVLNHETALVLFIGALADQLVIFFGESLSLLGSYLPGSGKKVTGCTLSRSLGILFYRC